MYVMEILQLRLEKAKTNKTHMQTEYEKNEKRTLSEINSDILKLYSQAILEPQPTHFKHSKRVSWDMGSQPTEEKAAYTCSTSMSVAKLKAEKEEEETIHRPLKKAMQVEDSPLYVHITHWWERVEPATAPPITTAPITLARVTKKTTMLINGPATIFQRLLYSGANGLATIFRNGRGLATIFRKR